MDRPSAVRAAFAAVLLVTAAPGRVPRAADDGPEWLAKAKAAALALPRLHAVVKVVDTPTGGAAATRFVECWIDVKGGRARTEVRDWKKALPSWRVCGGPETLRFLRLEVGEVAEQRGRFELPTLLAASFAGELLATTFRGDLVSMKAGAYQKPVVAAVDEKVDGEPCVRLRFGGNDESQLWISTRDGLPRRLAGAVPGRTLDETVTLLETDFPPATPDGGGVSLEVATVDGERLYDPVEAMKRWSSLPAESTRWPEVDDAADDFAALDLEGTTHLLSETGDAKAVLAFWNAEDPAAVEKAAEVERAWAEHGDPAERFLHLAALAQREPVAAAAAKRGLKQPVWVAGTHEKNAFRRFRVWTTPLFVRLDSMTVVAITRDAAEARRWFNAR
jgi:hypothetical protein